MPPTETIALPAALGLLLVHIVGVLHTIHVIMNGRTAQGTIAWIVSLAAMPYIAIPFYWILGRNKFTGYVRARRADDERLVQNSMNLRTAFLKYQVEDPSPLMEAAERLGGFPEVHGNDIKVLIDGEATFASLFEALETGYGVSIERVGGSTIHLAFTQ